jgi:hypothetical protein
MAPPFIAGGAGIARVSGWGLLAWALIALGFFGFLEIRVMCSHCPHYAEPGSTLRCWANYGAPKLWAYRPGPMSAAERFWFFAGFVAVLGTPLAFLLLDAQWLLLVLFASTTVAAATTLRLSFCSQCMNFACPLNTTGDAARSAFFERNPEVAEAWGPHP